MKFEINEKIILKLVLFSHVGLAIFDLRFLILPWVYISFNLWTHATQPFGAQWVPADIRKVRRMLEMANIKPGEILYDLGSGDGRIVAGATKLYRAKAIGVEIDPIRVLISRLKLKFNKLDKFAQIKHANFFNADLTDADIITIFLLPETVGKLKSKFKKELKAGSRIVSLQFPLEKWKPIKVDVENKIFVYEV